MRRPLIVLADCSAALDEAGARALAESLRGVKDAAAGAFDLALVSFGGGVRVLQPFVPVEQFEPLAVTGAGPCLLGAGLLKSLAMLERRALECRKAGLESLEPVVIVLAAGGGRPADLERGSTVWRDLAREAPGRAHWVPRVLSTGGEEGDEAAGRLLSDLLGKPAAGSREPISWKDALAPPARAAWPTAVFPAASQVPVRSPAGLKLFGGAVIGPLHVAHATPCQDACAFEALAGGAGVIAVADGLGSVEKSELGSRYAVDAALAAARTALEGAAPAADLAAVARSGVEAARRRLEALAGEVGFPLRELGCTLMVAVFKGGRLGVAHVGDGAVVARAKDGLALVSGPGDSEYANEVVPLTSSEWEGDVRVSMLEGGVTGVAAFTDGCQRAALRRSAQGLAAHERFFAPIFGFADELQDLEEGDREVRALLSSAKVCDNSDDDKTLVVAVAAPGETAG